MAQPPVSLMIAGIARAITVEGGDFPPRRRKKLHSRNVSLTTAIMIPEVVGCVDGTPIAIFHPKKLNPGAMEYD